MRPLLVSATQPVGEPVVHQTHLEDQQVVRLPEKVVCPTCQRCNRRNRTTLRQQLLSRLRQTRHSKLIQLTGRYNYQAFANFERDRSIMTNPDQVRDSAHPLLGFESAGWFFEQHGLNTLTNRAAGQRSDLFNYTITVAINGGTNGLASRLAYYRRIRALLLTPNF